MKKYCFVLGVCITLLALGCSKQHQAKHVPRSSLKAVQELVGTKTTISDQEAESLSRAPYLLLDEITSITEFLPANL